MIFLKSLTTCQADLLLQREKTTPHIENTTHAWVVEGREESQDSREVKQKEFFNLNHCLYGYSSALHCANKAEVLKPQD